jgi:hypothetical protein
MNEKDESSAGEDSLHGVEVESEGVDEEGNLVIGDLVAEVDSVGSIVAADETIAVVTEEGDVIVDETLSVVGDDGELHAIVADRTIIEADDEG